MIYYPKSFGNYFDEYKGIKMAFILKNKKMNIKKQLLFLMSH